MSNYRRRLARLRFARTVAKKAKRRQIKLKRRFSQPNSILPTTKPSVSRHFRRFKRLNYKALVGHRDIIEIKVPDNFSLINNTDAVLETFDKMKEALGNNSYVKLILVDLTDITPETIAMLAACLHDESFIQKGTLIGTNPKNPILKKRIEESGFFDHVTPLSVKPKKNSSMFLHIKTDNHVEPETAKTLCMCGIEHTFGKVFIFQDLYEILIECMQNTKEHASGKSPHKYEWWIFVYNDDQTKITHYTFLDLGVGIFESIYLELYKKLLKFAHLKKNVDYVEPLFSGQIRSSTGDPERGKGLPQIKNYALGTKFDNFTLISNDVKANLKTNRSESLNNFFPGTLYYWQLKNDEEQ